MRRRFASTLLTKYSLVEPSGYSTDVKNSATDLEELKKDDFYALASMYWPKLATDNQKSLAISRQISGFLKGDAFAAWHRFWEFIRNNALDNGGCWFNFMSQTYTDWTGIDWTCTDWTPTNGRM